MLQEGVQDIEILNISLFRYVAKVTLAVLGIIQLTLVCQLIGEMLHSYCVVAVNRLLNLLLPRYSSS